MRFQALTYLLIIFFLTISFGFSTENCDSKLELKEVKETSFLIAIEASGAFQAEIFYIEEGEYISQEEKSGNGNSEIEFNNIAEDRIYKITVKYSNSNPLCETRQLSGLKL